LIPLNGPPPPPHAHTHTGNPPSASKLGSLWSAAAFQAPGEEAGRARGTTNTPRHRKKPIRIVIGTAAILCVGITLLYSHRAQPSFKRGALYTPGNVIVTAIDGAPSPSSSQSSYVPRSEAFSSDLSVAEETASNLATSEDLGIEDVGDLPTADELSAVKALPLNPLADHEREEEVTLDKKTVEEPGEADFEDDGQGGNGDDKQQNEEEEESGELMEEEWEEGAEGDDDYNDDDDAFSGEVEEAEEEEEEEEQEQEQEEMEKEDEEIEDEEEEEKTLMEQDDAIAQEGESSKLSRDHSVTATTTEEEVESAGPLLAECQASYGDRRFLKEDEKALPPILYSFPGKPIFDKFTNASFIY